LSYRWHVAHFMLVVKGRDRSWQMTVPPLRFTASMSSVIVSV
jgi:hypothetical protein